MAGKRPDQYRIAPEETQATDYKTRPAQASDAARDDAAYSRQMEAKNAPWEAGRRPARGRTKARARARHKSESDADR